MKGLKREDFKYKMTDEEWDKLHKFYNSVEYNTNTLINDKHKKAMGEKLKNTGRQPTVLLNPHRDKISNMDIEAKQQLSDMYKISGVKAVTINFFPHWFDDIISCVTRLDYHGEGGHPPLSISKIMTILTSKDEITVRDISNTLFLGKKQSTRYFNAIKVLLPQIDKHYSKGGKSLLDKYRELAGEI